MPANKKYILCPRCELNYITEDEKYCNVCKAELGIIDKSILIPEDDESEEKLCPICHVNYIEGDEEMCFLCRKEHAEKDEEIGEENDDSWMDYMDEEDEVASPEELEISLELAAEEEDEEEEDDTYHGPDEFDYGSKKSDDDFDDDFDEDFDEDDEDDEDDDDDDDDEDDD